MDDEKAARIWKETSIVRGIVFHELSGELELPYVFAYSARMEGRFAVIEGDITFRTGLWVPSESIQLEDGFEGIPRNAYPGILAGPRVYLGRNNRPENVYAGSIDEYIEKSKQELEGSNTGLISGVRGGLEIGVLKYSLRAMRLI